MKKLIIIISLFSIIACKDTKKTNDYKSIPTAKITETETQPVHKGYKLMKSYCYSCHNPNTTSHDAIIAPPMIAIKTRYKKEYKTKKQFIDAISNWVQNADKKDALMLGAVEKFNVMPKLPFPTKQLNEIADYVYDNEIETPKWFSNHKSTEKCDDKN
jgi:hypothetical protein